MPDDEPSTPGISPNEAFAILADETRLGILRMLGDAGRPLSFSELFERIDYDDSANFSYHLEKLDGHFVHKTDEGYRLREAGRRVVEAVLSGIVTDTPVIEPTEIDECCPFCGASIAVSFHQEHVDIFCPDCAGAYGRVGSTKTRDLPDDYGYLGAVHLPPAGLQDRSALDMTQAALTWGTLEILAVSSGVCPRCSGQFDESIAVCETHDLADGICADCGKRHAVQIRYRCPICRFEEGGGFWNALWADPDFLSYLLNHGVDPISPSPSQFALIVSSFEEEVRSVEPFEARFTYTIDGESINLTVNKAFEVVDVTRQEVEVTESE